jgi:hypothetical protein
LLKWKERQTGSHDDVNIQHIHHAELSSVCDLTPEHLDAIVSSGTGLKFFVTVGTGLLYSQPFTKSHFHFLINTKFVHMGQIHQCAGGFAAR